MEKCPNGTIYNEFTNICNEEKDLESTIYTIDTTIFIKTDFSYYIQETTIIEEKEEEEEIDEDNYLTDENKISIEDKLLINLQEDIISGRLDDIIKNVTENKEDYVMTKDNIIH